MPFLPWVATTANAPTPLSVALGGTGATSAAGAAASLGIVYQQSVSALAGYTLVNGTGTIAQVTTPNDGAVHTVQVSTIIIVSVAETGGQIQTAFTAPDNSAQTQQNHAAGLGTGLARTSMTLLCRPNTTVTLSQNSALTVGAAVLWASIWVN
jgi:Tfp pilus assembly protein PilW